MENCYYCSEEASTEEHVPPRSFFTPSSKSIKVPSCERHNTERSKDDEYFRMVICGYAWENVPDYVRGKVIRSAKRGRGPATKILNNVYKTNERVVSYDAEVERLENCAESIARALIFFNYGTRPNLDQRPQVIQHFVENTLDAPELVNQQYASLRWLASRILDELPYEQSLAPTFKYRLSGTIVQFTIYGICTFTVIFDG